jgi:hypothetical protein
MAPARAITIGHDQHVLAEGGQTAAAQRTSIGRGLQVLRPADVPPVSGLAAGHSPKDDTPAQSLCIVARWSTSRSGSWSKTARYRVTGALRLPRDGYRSRLSDFLNASDREFIALTDVQVETLDDRAPPEHRRFVAVALRHVVLAAPLDEEDEG